MASVSARHSVFSECFINVSSPRKDYNVALGWVQTMKYKTTFFIQVHFNNFIIPMYFMVHI